MKHINTLSLLLLILSCKPEKEQIPADVLPKDKMVEILVNVHLVEGSIALQRLTGVQLDLLASKKYDSLFMAEKVPVTNFRSSYDYYLDHPKDLDDIYQEVVNQLSTLQGKYSGAHKPRPFSPDSLIVKPPHPNK